MPDHAHDVRAMSGLVEGMLHGLAIHRQGLVVHPPRGVPGLERPIQRLWVNADQAIADDKFTRDDTVAVLTPTAEAYPGLLSQTIRPIRDRLISAHAAECCARGKAQHHRQAMAAPLRAARIGNGPKALRCARICSALSMIWGAPVRCR